jgi:hypothetical protein
MNMLFRTVKDGLNTLLADNAGGRFSVEGFQRQSHAAEEMVGQKRHVTVFYRSGQFDKSKSGWHAGPFKHAATYQVELTLAAPASADLSALTSANATPQQLMSALSAMQPAAKAADDLWDELGEYIYQILMDPRNSDTMGGVPISDRWISNISKESPAPMGEYVLLGGTMDYTCTLTETPSGETGTPAGANAMDIDLTVTTPAGTAADSAKAGAKAGGL